MLSAIRLLKCPALECESQAGVRPILPDEFPDVYEKLEERSRGLRYDYYHCKWWCKRLWRIRCVERHRYEEPQWIGAWHDDDMSDSEPRVFSEPREQALAVIYRRSLNDPSRPARNITDATRRRAPRRRR